MNISNVLRTIAVASVSSRLVLMDAVVKSTEAQKQTKN